MQRREWLTTITSSVTLGLFSIFDPSNALHAVETADLKTTLEKGLRVRRPSEFQFIGTVVTAVDDDRLPRTIVIGTFDWARKRSLSRPFYYFQPAIRVRARRLGVTL